MRVRFIGTGDAFGSGGRLHTCFHVTGRAINFLIDIGASSLIGLKANGIKLNNIQAIFVTHFHADHFGGIPFFILDARFFSKRTEPLTIAGPVGLPEWYERVMETSIPGSSETKPKFELNLIELKAGSPIGTSGVQATPFQAVHGKPNGPFLSYRIEAEGKTIAYTGDTEWSDALVELGRGADLFIAEAYFFDKKVKMHLDLDSIARNLDQIRPKRLILTHMSDDMLDRLGSFPYETAFDGLVIDV